MPVKQCSSLISLIATVTELWYSLMSLLAQARICIFAGFMWK